MQKIHQWYNGNQENDNQNCKPLKDVTPRDSLYIF